MNDYFDAKVIKQYYPGVENMLVRPMLIWKLPPNKQDKLSEVCESGEYFMQEKIDGLLYIYYKGIEGQNYLFARTVSKKTGVLVEKGQNVPHILSALDGAFPNGTAILGEIYYDGCNIH